MTSWETSYWRVFNILVRVLGLVALVSGVAFTMLGAARILEQGLLLNAGAPGLVILLVGLLAGALGAAILRVPAYRPDLGDVSWRFDPFGAKTRQSASARRSWWTGER